jgi:hypothetical protein
MDSPQLIRSLKPMLLGQNPLERERIHAGMRLINRIVSYRVIGAVDTALWDLAGKIAGMPVHALMGTYRSSIPAYAGSQVLPDAAAYAEQAQAFKAAGWQAYKIHTPRDPDHGIRVCQAVRKAVGDDFRLMLDSTWSYDFIDALRVGRAIEELGFYWYEDPLADEDIHNYVKLRQKLDIPIMAREFPAGGLDTYPIWLTQQATDFLRGDIPNKGGLTTMLTSVPFITAHRTLSIRVRATRRPTHLLLGVHPPVQQPLHRAFRDRRRDWLLAPPGRRIVDDDIGLTAYIGLEFAEKARHFQRDWTCRQGRCGFERRHGFADESETASDLAVPEPPADPLNRFAQAGAGLAIRRRSVRPALGRLSNMLDAHRKMEPVQHMAGWADARRRTE